MVSPLNLPTTITPNTGNTTAVIKNPINAKTALDPDCWPKSGGNINPVLKKYRYVVAAFSGVIAFLCCNATYNMCKEGNFINKYICEECNFRYVIVETSGQKYYEVNCDENFENGIIIK